MKKGDLKKETAVNINHTHGLLKIDELSQGINLIKVGKRYFVVDIIRTACSCFVEIYNYFDRDFSKYDESAEREMFKVKPFAYLTRAFIENRMKIKSGILFLKNYKDVLDY